MQIAVRHSHVGVQDLPYAHIKFAFLFFDKRMLLFGKLPLKLGDQLSPTCTLDSFWHGGGQYVGIACRKEQRANRPCYNNEEATVQVCLGYRRMRHVCLSGHYTYRVCK